MLDTYGIEGLTYYTLTILRVSLDTHRAPEGRTCIYNVCVCVYVCIYMYVYIHRIPSEGDLK